MNDLFSDEGIAAWRDHLDESDDFRRAAGSWSGTLLLVEGTDDDPIRSTWLKVGDGRIVESRLGEPADRRSAEFVLAAGANIWRDLVGGKRELISSAMRGDLKLVSGSVFRLLPHARAASELLRAAAD